MADRMVPLAVLLLVTALSSRATADEVPQRINLQGAMATQSGSPVQGTFKLTVRLYADATSTTVLHMQAFPAVDVKDGVFDIVVDPLPQALVDAHGLLWSEVQVGTEAPLPRQPVLPSVYALRARTADVAATAKGLACSGCVDDTEVTFPWAKGDGPNGAAMDLACSGCVKDTHLASGSVGSGQLQAGAVKKSHVGFNYASSDAPDGPATNVKCSTCVDETEVTFPWAAALSAGGGAAGLDCTDCVGAKELTDGSIGTVELKAGAVGKDQVSFNYAGSASQGGPATDVACTNCIDGGDMGTNVQMTGSLQAEGSLTACSKDAANCTLGVGSTVDLVRTTDNYLNIQSPSGLRIRSATNDAWRDLFAGKGVFYGGVQVDGATALNGAVSVGGTLDLAKNQLQFVRIHNATSSPVPCTPTVTGLMYFNTSDNRLYICNGADYFGVSTSIVGSEGNPGESCAHIKAENPGATDGVYWLKPAGVSTPFQNYCDMTTAGGGWTLVMKLDGNSTVFSYDAALWTNQSAYAPQDVNFDTKQAKFESYHSVPFEELRVGINVGGTTNWLQMSYSANSLWDLLKDGQYKPTTLGRNTWKTLVPSPSLQPNCNREGFNNYHSYSRVRIGIVANQENDCGSPDSRIGLGGQGNACGQDDSNSCGNTATCSPDNGDKNTKGFGYIFVRKAVLASGSPGTQQNPAQSCQHIKTANSAAQSGVYWIAPSGAPSPFQAYCDMVADGGGWTLLMKLDGNSTTFSYDSAQWTSATPYNPQLPGLDTNQAKLQSYSTLAFTQLRLGMQVGSTTKWITVPYTGTSLYDVLKDGSYKATSLGRNAWKSLIDGSSLQPYCNREGFNNYHSYARVRIGYIANQENDCNSPDSRIGFGGQGNACGQDDSNSCGNTATCSPDAGDKNTKAFGYVLAR